MEEMIYPTRKEWKFLSLGWDISLCGNLQQFQTNGI